MDGFRVEASFAFIDGLAASKQENSTGDLRSCFFAALRADSNSDHEVRHCRSDPRGASTGMEPYTQTLSPNP